MASHPLAGLLGKLNHVAIATPNLEKSSKFYKDLGAKVSDPVVCFLVLMAVDQTIKVVFLQLGRSSKLRKHNGVCG